MSLWLVLAVCHTIGSLRADNLNPLDPPAAAPELLLNSKALPPGALPRGARRQRLARVNPAALAAAHQPEAKLKLGLFDGRTVNLHIKESSVSTWGETLKGQLEGQPQSTVILVRYGKALAGNVQFENGQLFRLLPAPDGTVLLVEADPENELPCGVLPDSNKPPTTPDSKEALPVPAKDGTALPTVLDMLVVYTPAARLAAGGHEAMLALIRTGVELANTAYTNSRIEARLRLVHAQEINFVEPPTTSNLATELNLLRGTDDGVMDEVHALRNAHGADQVTLVIKDANSRAAGLARLRRLLPEPFDDRAFAVVLWNYVNGLTLAHEIGHNLGCAHDRQNAGDAMFPFAYGWRFYGTNHVLYRTVMAYEPGERVPYFSNPQVNYLGTPTGVLFSEPDQANNAYAINVSIPSAHDWRATTDTTPPDVFVSSPINGSTEPWFPTVHGLVIDNLDLLLRVSVRIQALNLPPEEPSWWDGGAFRSTPVDLPISLREDGWSLDYRLVLNPPRRCGQSYAVTVSAVDGAGLTSQKTVTFALEGTLPTVQITSHTPDQSVVELVGGFYGWAASAGAPLAGVAYVVRGYDRGGNFMGWWNGNWFQPVPTNLPCNWVLTWNTGVPTAQWHSVASAPPPYVAPGERYELEAVAWTTSGCTNSASVSVHVPIWGVDYESTPGTDGPVYALAVQPDGKFLAGGDFTTLNTTLGSGTRNSLGRVLPVGGADSFFDAAIGTDAPNDVFCLAMQPDGRILLGGQYFVFGFSQQPYLARLQSNGSLDWSFSAWWVSGSVRALAVQPDGKIVVASESPTQRILRLQPDGSLDASFNASAGSQINSVALQPDGMIVVGGLFTTVNDQPRQHLGRLRPDGTLDGAFDPGANAEVHTVVVQPDGKIIVGGDFGQIGGQSHSRLARLDRDGKVEGWFNTGAGANGRVETIALQADGRIVVGGQFSLLHGESREGLGRLMPDGSLDSSFAPMIGAALSVHALGLHADGTLIVGGSFGPSFLFSGSNLARLDTFGRAPEYVGLKDGRLAWMRGGSSPEVWRVTFEYSTNNVDWSALGAGWRIPGGWERTGVSVPAGANVRARGWTTGGRGNGSAWFVESQMGPPQIAIPPESQARCPGPGQGTSFNVSVVGSGPFTFRWRKDSVELDDNSHFQGVTTATLQVAALNQTLAGAYDVVVANSRGSVVSTPATLRITGPPTITTQPASVTRNVGESATLVVQVDGPDLVDYQWRRAGDPLNGETNAWLTLHALQATDAGLYDVVVTSACGGATSHAAELAVNLAHTADFNPQFQHKVHAIAPCPDGRVLIAGKRGISPEFDDPSILILTSHSGAVETAFTPDVEGTPYCLATRVDGGVWVGGDLGLPGELTRRLVRFNADGTLGAALTLAPILEGEAAVVRCLAHQADGKLLVGGDFSGLDDKVHYSLARLNADGTVDDGFHPDVRGKVIALAIQPDGRILVGGQLLELAGRSCVNLERLNPDGTTDGSFQHAYPGSNFDVTSLALQFDGKILVGGFANELLRLDFNGELDASFNRVVWGMPFSRVSRLALQADGKILLGGLFGISGSSVNLSPRRNLLRFYPNGTQDPTFAPDPDGEVAALALEAGGAILTGGGFGSIAGKDRLRVARLVNPDAATEALAITPSNITWQRGGSAPEVWRATFESSTDGVNWTALGTGVRVAGGWQLAGLALAAGSQVRARGFVGASGGSDYFVETVAPSVVTLHLEDASVQPEGFRFRFLGLAGQRYHVESRSSLAAGDWIEFAQRLGTGSVETITDPITSGGERYYRLRITPQ